MMWECCRHLQKAQTLDGSGPMRLGSSFRFQSSKTPVIVALALGRPAMTFYARNALLSTPCHRDSCVEACCGQMYSSPSSCNSNCEDEKGCTYACDRISGMSPNRQLLCPQHCCSLHGHISRTFHFALKLQNFTGRDPGESGSVGRAAWAKVPNAERLARRWTCR